MTQIRLHRASSMLLIGKRITARMPEHVRVDPKVKSSRFAETGDQSAEPPVANGAPRSEVNTNDDLGACSR